VISGRSGGGLAVCAHTALGLAPKTAAAVITLIHVTSIARLILWFTVASAEGETRMCIVLHTFDGIGIAAYC
jgi:hypothetical protein